MMEYLAQEGKLWTSLAEPSVQNRANLSVGSNARLDGIAQYVG